MKISHISYLLFLVVVMAIPARAQVLDRVIAVIGEEIILESDVENQYNYMIINGQKDDGTLRCQVMDNLIVGKLLLNKAQQDSIEVSDEEVTSEIDSRTNTILSQLDDPNDFEEIYGKSVYEFKAEVRDDIRNEILTDRMRSSVMSDVSCTPREVREFYESIDKDSLGLLPAEVELNHILAIPPFSEESKQAAKEKLTEVRRKLVEENARFEEMALQFSMDGSARSGGDLGTVMRGQMVPDFEEVVYSLRIGDISQVFETEFGYHIAKVTERKGEILKASHILIIPSRSTNGDSLAIAKLNKALDLVSSDSLTFEQAAILFSEDRSTKDCGGCISNPQTGELRIPMDLLDADLFFKIDEMEEGEISDPMEYMMPDGSPAFHVLYLKNKIPPHVPNMKDDYNKIYNATIQVKQAQVFDEWLTSAKKNIYIHIKPTECSNALKNWIE